MLEVILILALGIFYVIPFTGIIKLNTNEEEFLDAYNSFTVIEPIEETQAEELIGGDSSESTDLDVPTMMDFGSQENTNNNSNNDTTDIDISNMGR